METVAAGPDLDARIALLMGAQLIDYAWYDGTRKPFLWWPDDSPPRGDDFQRLPNGWLCEWNSIPPYSTSIAAAFTIVDHLLNDPSLDWEGFELVSMPRRPNEDQVAEWRASFANRWGEARAFAPTRSLAICNAALMAVQSNP